MVKSHPQALLELPGFDGASLLPQVLSLVSSGAQDLYALIRACPALLARGTESEQAFRVQFGNAKPRYSRNHVLVNCF